MNAPPRAWCWLRPTAIWLVVLAAVFLTELGIMFVLPGLLPPQAPRWLEALVDAVILTAVLAPMMWLAVIRPLREVIRLRTQFLVDLFARIEADRRQTAHELHDGVGQSLTLLVSGLRSSKCREKGAECVGRIDAFQRLAEDALLDVRRLALGLRPSLLDDLGLAPALERLVADVRVHHPVEITLDVAGLDGERLPDDVATAVFRIVQESVANVVKHSHARHASVTARRDNGQVCVEVADDGCGIEPQCLRAPPPGHLGLIGMRERATLLGGELSVLSTPGAGTVVQATLPAKEVAHG